MWASKRFQIELAGVSLVALVLTVPVNTAYSQFGLPDQSGTPVTIQLPSVTSFGINTSVMVPDGGAMRLGGVGRGASGYGTAGIPLLGSVPGLSPLFRSQAFGSSYSAGQSSVRVHLIISRELEEDVLAEADRRIAARRSIDPNGSAEIQQRAAFISRNVGRR